MAGIYSRKMLYTWLNIDDSHIVNSLVAPIVHSMPPSYNFIPSTLCTRNACRMLRSSMISSEPPGMA